MNPVTHVLDLSTYGARRLRCAIRNSAFAFARTMTAMALAAPLFALAGPPASDSAMIASTNAKTRGDASNSSSVRPYRVNIPQSALDDLRKRVQSTRWPDKETVNDQSQGAQLAKVQALVDY